MCDMAETYGIYDLRSLPVTTIATLACGLREDSRIIRKMSGGGVKMDTLLLAMVVDRLSLLVWSKTRDGEKGRGRPSMIAKKLAKGRERPKNDLVGFDHPADFMAARAKFLKKGGEIDVN